MIILLIIFWLLSAGLSFILFAAPVSYFGNSNFWNKCKAPLLVFCCFMGPLALPISFLVAFAGIVYLAWKDC